MQSVGWLAVGVSQLGACGAAGPGGVDAGTSREDAALADGGPCGPPARLGSTLPGDHTLNSPINMVLYVEASGIAHLAATAVQSDEQGGNRAVLTAAALGPDLLMVARSQSSGAVFDIAVPSLGLATRVHASVNFAGPSDDVPPALTSSLALSWSRVEPSGCGAAAFEVRAAWQHGTDGPELPGSYNMPLAYVLYAVDGAGAQTPVASKLTTLPRADHEGLTVRVAMAGRRCFVVGAWDIAGHETIDPAQACVDLPE
jgi:hypothetical protein